MNAIEAKFPDAHPDAIAAYDKISKAAIGVDVSMLAVCTHELMCAALVKVANDGWPAFAREFSEQLRLTADWLDLQIDGKINTAMTSDQVREIMDKRRY